jgi:DNA repair exonuclease SbcCD ATPase subunit
MKTEEITSAKKILASHGVPSGFPEMFSRLEAAMEEYASLKLKEYETAYNQVCERNDRLQEENDNLKKQLHDHNGMCQKKLSDQLNDVMRDFKAKQEEVDRLKEVNKEHLEALKKGLSILKDPGYETVSTIYFFKNAIEEFEVQTP